MADEQDEWCSTKAVLPGRRVLAGRQRPSRARVARQLRTLGPRPLASACTALSLRRSFERGLRSVIHGGMQRAELGCLPVAWMGWNLEVALRPRQVDDLLAVELRVEGQSCQLERCRMNTAQNRELTSLQARHLLGRPVGHRH